jgi:hypothetical protein
VLQLVGLSGRKYIRSKTRFLEAAILLRFMVWLVGGIGGGSVCRSHAGAVPGAPSRRAARSRLGFAETLIIVRLRPQ